MKSFNSLTIVLVLCATISYTQCSLADVCDLGEGVESGQMNDEDMEEASGLAYSRLQDGVLYTINDKGGLPAVIALSEQGEKVGFINLDGVDNTDYEDIATTVEGGVSFILVSDTGNNDFDRDPLSIFKLRDQNMNSGDVTVSRDEIEELHVRYEGFSYDCEALAVDEPTGDFFMFTKDRENSISEVSRLIFCKICRFMLAGLQVSLSSDSGQQPVHSRCSIARHVSN